MRLRLLTVIQHGGSVGNLPKYIANILTDTTSHEESHLKVLRLLESNPRMNQRELSRAMGISLGKTNYCIKALLDKGLIKVQNFRNSQNKLAYAYLLTPAGVDAKARITVQFLKNKIQEYERLRIEIEMMQLEADQKSSIENKQE